MSFDPNAAGPLPAPGAPPVPLVPPVKATRRRSGLVVAVIGVVAGLAAAAVTFVLQRSAYTDAVGNLQRAASGLQTDFVFERQGTFTLYYEYDGTFEVEVDGEDEEFELDAPSTPRRVDLTLIDEAGEEVRLRRNAPDIAYDVAGFAGLGYRTVDIDDPGEYRLSVTGRERDEFAIAIGHGTLRRPGLVLPALLALAGLVVGVLGLVLGRSKRVSLAAPSAPGPIPTSSGPWMPGPPAAGLSGGWGVPPVASAPPGVPTLGPPTAPPLSPPPPPVPAPPVSAQPAPPAPPAPPAANHWPPPPG